MNSYFDAFLTLPKVIEMNSYFDTFLTLPKV